MAAQSVSMRWNEMVFELVRCCVFELVYFLESVGAFVGTEEAAQND